MKRGGPLKRKTPMQRTPMKRAVRVPSDMLAPGVRLRTTCAPGAITRVWFDEAETIPVRDNLDDAQSDAFNTGVGVLLVSAAVGNPLAPGAAGELERINAGLERVAARWGLGPADLKPAPKRGEIRSEALLEAVRRVPFCTRCGVACRPDPAHSNWGIHGKGGARKADDNRIAALCRPCHDMIDQHWPFDEDSRRRTWWDAHVATVNYLVTRGRWPAVVPPPDLTFPPEWMP